MRRLLVIAATLFALAFPASTLAASQFYPSSCATDWRNDASRVYLYENTISDTSNGNDYLIDCLNLDQLDMKHVPTGSCNAVFKPVFDDWSDCISSIRAYIPSGWKLCLYRGFNWLNYMGGISSNFNGGRYDMSWFGFPNDALRSYRYVLASQPCYEG